MKKTLLGLTLISSIVLASDGASLYKNCIACHGDKGQKAALGKSKVINTMTHKEFVAALTGYQNDTYGASMKALMKSKVAKLNAEDINALAEYITVKK